MERKEEQAKIRKIIRKIILFIILIIILYLGYGFYKEEKIKLLNESEVLIKKTKYIKESIEVEDNKNNFQLIDKEYKGYKVEAKLEIPKIELETNILKDYSIKALKISATKFWGPEANEIGNFCIAGHNKEKMFNHLIDLEIGDKLYLTDNKNGKYTYIVYDIYKVKPENILPIEQETNGKRIVTLITCANYSKNRLIIKAMEK